MSDLTPELNLALAVDDDDTADYLVTTQGLHGSLLTVDGLFNATTGHSHYGSHNGAPVNPAGFPDNSIPGAKLVDGSVTYAKLAANIVEALFAGTYAAPVTNYVVVAPVMYVFAQAALTVTLPAIATNRPITVAALNGQVTVTAQSGGVIGGSINTSTGAVMNGICSTGDSLTFKSEGANWRVV
jgi:hypothetical protein